MAQSLYTPFMTQGAASMVKGYEQGQAKAKEKEINTAAQRAYMGDPIALQDLAALDPEMAMKVEDQAGQRQQRSQQTDLYEQTKEANRRKFAVENREIMEDLTANIGAFDDFELAKSYAADQIGQLKTIMGEENVPLEELTPEQFEQFRQLRQVVTGDDWERSGQPQLEQGPDGKPIRVQTFVNPKTREVRTVPVSLGRALTAHDPELAGQISYSKKEGATQAEIDLKDAEVIAGMSAEAKADLIPARQRATSTIGIIQQLREHPGRTWATGLGWLNPGKYAPGTDAHDFMILADQAQGKIFAEAYETLKGGGQITEIESRKAEQAIARMETSQSQAEYLQALDEFEQATRNGYEKLLSIASTDPDKFRQLMAGELSAPLPGSDKKTEGTVNNPHQPDSKAAYDALESGQYYMRDGKLRRKK